MAGNVAMALDHGNFFQASVSGPLAAPSATTTPASNVTTTSATLNGSVNANGLSTSVVFKWGTSSGSYPNTLAAAPSPLSDSTNTPVSAALAGLTPNTTYYYIVSATSAGGTTNGAEQSFTTAPLAAPSATTAPASNVTTTSATLNGSVNANGLSTSVVFKWGTSSGSYPNTLAATPSPLSDSTNTPVSAALAGLTPNTTYYYIVSATSAGGTTNGAEQSFKTAPLSGIQVTDFNLFVLGKLEHRASAVEGRVAVGGDASLNAYLVGTKLPNSNGTRDDLIVGGNLDFNSGKVLNGNIVYGGSAKLKNVAIPHGSARKVGDPLALAATQSYVAGVAARWAALPANGTTSIAVKPNKSTAITLTGSDPVQNVFTLAGADLAKADSLQINVPDGSSVVVNINGATATMKTLLTLRGTDSRHIVYNFYQATKLKMQLAVVRGTVWAPFADVTFDGGTVEGTLLAKSFKGAATAFTLAPFAGVLP